MRTPGEKAVDFGKVGKTATESRLEHDKKDIIPQMSGRVAIVYLDFSKAFDPHSGVEVWAG